MDDHPPETVAAVAPFNFLQQLQVNRHCSKPSKRLCPAAPYYQPQKLIRAVYIKRLLLVVLNIGEIIYNNIIHRALFVGEIHPTFPVKTVTFSLSLSLGAIFLLVLSFSWSLGSKRQTRQANIILRMWQNSCPSNTSTHSKPTRNGSDSNNTFNGLVSIKEHFWKIILVDISSGFYSQIFTWSAFKERPTPLGSPCGVSVGARSMQDSYWKTQNGEALL